MFSGEESWGFFSEDDLFLVSVNVQKQATVKTLLFHYLACKNKNTMDLIETLGKIRYNNQLLWIRLLRLERHERFLDGAGRSSL